MAKTHLGISKDLVGIPISVIDGKSSIVDLKTNTYMAVDESGLIHGGFTFGLADYAAMIAVNHPNVVLASANVRFTSPVKVGETMRAEATVMSTEGRKSEVRVEIKVGEKSVFSGEFTCYTLAKHILS